MVDLRWLGELLGWVMVVAVLVGAGLLARHLWRHRWHPPEPPESADFEVLPDLHRVAAALARDSAAQLEAVAEGSPDGIQRCWLRVEESVAEAGVRREPWETTAELTVRVLRLLDLDPRAIGGSPTSTGRRGSPGTSWASRSVRRRGRRCTGCTATSPSSRPRR